MKIIEASFEIINYTPEAINTIMRSARCCYQSEPVGNPDTFVRDLVKRGHMSVIEHGSITVKFVIDRATSMELIRHRLASFSQESTRYCNYKDKDIEFIKPQGMGGLNPELKMLVWRSAMTKAEEHYKEMIDFGASPQIARSVLPNSLKTELYMTANMREWRHVLALRTSKAAHPDIRHIMLQVLNEFKHIWPVLFEDINQED